jgi:hypothetical protein
MMEQQVFNIAIALVGALGGWWMKAMWDGLKDMSSQVTNLQVMVAGQYVRREEFDKSMDSIISKLERIEDKIDKKVDK